MNESDSSVSSLQPSLAHEDIARRAQELWIAYGQPVGRDEEIWLEAERCLLAGSTASAPSPTPPTAPTPPRRSNAIATARMPGGSRTPRTNR